MFLLLGITPQQIFDSVARQNTVAAGGAVDTAADRINVRVTGAFSGVEAVAAVPVQADGRVFRLSDIATVKRDYEDPPGFIVRNNGKVAIGLGVSMQDGANLVTLGRDLNQTMTGIMSELPVGFEVSQIANQPHIVEESVSEFFRTFAEALVIVLVVSFISLGWRTGIVVALSVPMVLAIVFAVMYAAGIDLHRITLGALIIALGLLVDDAIIAIEMMVVKMEQGFDRARAATFAWTSTAFPMLTGTLVTAAGFLPVGFAKSSAGEYAGGIFWIVGLALIASWFVAVVFTPYLGLKLLPDFAKRAAKSEKHARALHDPDAVYDTRIYRGLRRAIEVACAGARPWCSRPSRCSSPRSPASGWCSNSSSRPRPAPSCSSKCGCRKAPPSASPTPPPARPRSCSRATTTSPATRPTSGPARRASGSGSTRCCRTRTLRRS